MFWKRGWSPPVTCPGWPRPVDLAKTLLFWPEHKPLKPLAWLNALYKQPHTDLLYSPVIFCSRGCSVGCLLCLPLALVVKTEQWTNPTVLRPTLRSVVPRKLSWNLLEEIKPKKNWLCLSSKAPLSSLFALFCSETLFFRMGWWHWYVKCDLRLQEVQLLLQQPRGNIAFIPLQLFWVSEPNSCSPFFWDVKNISSYIISSLTQRISAFT